MGMINPEDYVEHVGKAQAGDIESLDRLVQLTREPLLAYVFRITLQEDLTQDIVQETMLEMFKVIGKLNRADRFWPWLCKIALNKVHRHYRTEKRHKTLLIEQFESGEIRQKSQEGLTTLVGQELKQVVVEAMSKLKMRYREVLSLRCYEQMDYAEIAELMDCTEFNARVTFCRAKKALQKQLSRSGFGKASLLGALILFGKLTSPSEAIAAQVSLGPATVKAGLLAGAVGTAVSSSGAATLATAGVIAVGSIWGVPALKNQLTDASSKDATRVVSLQAEAQKGFSQTEYYYPEATDGPVTMREIQTDDAAGQNAYCAWKMDDEGNYSYDRNTNTVTQHNHRIWRPDLKVRRLPTDTPELRQFLEQRDGTHTDMECIQDQRYGLMVTLKRNGSASDLKYYFHPTLLDELWQRYNWQSAKTTDQRDALHQQGWCYFRIEGRIQGQRVSGEGRMPFVYKAYATHPPWLRLRVSNQLELIDTVDGACVNTTAGQVEATCPSGAFFTGLARPWMGIHTLDTVRRDAAMEKIRYEVQYQPESGKALVTLNHAKGKLIYTIDMYKDWVEKIRIVSTTDASRKNEGELRFTYLGGGERETDEFRVPIFRRSPGTETERPGLNWLIYLAGMQLDK
jgi:RNA polymerase sigma-70 factor, ECF subfamily